MRTRACLLVLLAISGCFATSSHRPDVSFSAASPSNTGSTVSRPPSNWSRIHLEISGGPGEWTLAYQPFSKPRHAIAAEIEVRGRAAPNPDGETLLMTQAALPIRDCGEGPEIAFASWVDSSRTDPSGGSVDAYQSHVRSWGSSSCTFVGVVLFAGATTKWNESIRLKFDEKGGPTIGPQVIRNGSGIHHWAAEATLPLVSRVSLTHDVEAPGWLHLEVARTPEMLADQALVNGTWPNGDAILHLGGSSFGQDAPFENTGNFDGSAGHFEATYTGVDVPSQVRLRLIAILGVKEALPAGMKFGYYWG